jgi:outer membrane protein
MKQTSGVILAAIAAFLFVITLPLPAGAMEFGARGFWWMPSLNANIRVDKSGIQGDNISLKDDLGLDDRGTYSVEAFAGTKNHHFSIMYTPLEYSGSKTVNRDITFNGQIYPVNTAVDSSIKIRMYDMEYQYDLINLENVMAGFSIGILGKVKYIAGETKLASAATGETKQTFTVPIPMIGAGMHIGLIADLLETRVKGAWIGYSGNSFYDASAEISLTPFPFLDIHGGYRLMKIKVDNISDVYGDMDFYGPYVGISIGF